MTRTIQFCLTYRGEEKSVLAAAIVEATGVAAVAALSVTTRAGSIGGVPVRMTSDQYGVFSALLTRSGMRGVHITAVRILDERETNLVDFTRQSP